MYGGGVENGGVVGLVGTPGQQQQAGVAPVQTQLVAMGPQGQIQGQPGPPGPGQISLSLLIDFLVQKVYHDLVVLGELLPR